MLSQEDQILELRIL